MFIEFDLTLQDGVSFEDHLKDVVREDAQSAPADMALFSAEAIAAFKDAAIEPIKDGTFSLGSIKQRITTVRSEITQVWNSALPDGEKNRQISAKENEIAILQAGLFTFAQAGFSLSV